LSEITLRAPATIANFGPGFDIFALALRQPVDTLKIRLNQTRSISVTVSGRDEVIPTAAEKNTAGLAAIHFFKKTMAPAGVEVEIIKEMAAGAGLGSSAASAVASVYGLNKLLRTNLTDNEIIEIASRGEVASGGTRHADNVAGCLLGGFIFVRNQQPLDVVKIAAPEIPVVLSVLKKPRVTTRGFIPDRFSLAEVKEQMSWCSSVIYAVLSGDLEKIGRAVNRDNISEPARSRFIPGYAELKKRVLEAGAFGCNVSGGGSSLFAICPQEKKDGIAEVMRTFARDQGTPAEIIQTEASNGGLRDINEL
jgi:homoserine kinase